jgi:hypothetical protein
MEKFISLHFLTGVVFFILMKIEQSKDNHMSAIFAGTIALVFFVVDIYKKFEKRKK